MRSIESKDVPSPKPVRVLQIIEATLGGTMRYIENIAAAMDHSVLQFGIAYGTHRADSRLRPLLDRVQARGWSVYPVDMRRELHPLHDLRALYSLHRAITDFKPDIVHCHSSKGGALGRIAAAARSHSPVALYTPHALAAPLGSHYLKIEHILSRFTSGYVAVSDSEREEIERFGLNRDSSVGVVYPLVDSEFFAPTSKAEARRALGFSEAPLVLGVGRLTAQKDPGSFVAIIKRLREARPDVQALWLGAGEGEPEFRQQIHDADLEAVIRVIPWQHDVRPYLASADVLLSTSAFESFGYMVAEALAMGIPAVATDITGTCDIMRGELRDWLYPKRDFARASAMLEQLLGHPEQAAELGRVGREEIERRFSAHQMRNALLWTYTQSLKRCEARHSAEKSQGDQLAVRS